MCPEPEKIVRSGGSMLPFHSTSRRSRRRRVRRTTCHMTTPRVRSNQIMRSARSARMPRTRLYCHSVTHPGPALNRKTSAWKSSRGVQSGPWYRASISTCGTPSTSETRRATVVFPDPDVPATSARVRRPGSASSAPRCGICSTLWVSPEKRELTCSDGRCWQWTPTRCSRLVGSSPRLLTRPPPRSKVTRARRTPGSS